MDKNDKIKALKSLLANGEYECARVVADDWDMTDMLKDLVITRYEAEQMMLADAKKMVEFYTEKGDVDMIVFWCNAVCGYEKRIARMTVAEAQQVLVR